MNRRRLDEEIAARGLLPSRARARDAVLRGSVSVNGVAARKPSQRVGAEDGVSVRDGTQDYVSRGALKLLHALNAFDIDVADCVCIDIGASTGGFTQVLLERGARHVTAIDVGHGQMAPALAGDGRVRLIEGLNARAISDAHFPRDCTMMVCDVSFISLRLALPAAMNLASSGTTLVALIKPQFEAGRDRIGKGGIVTDSAVHDSVCAEVRRLVENAAWRVLGIVAAPLTGGDGNQEFLIAARKT